MCPADQKKEPGESWKGHSGLSSGSLALYSEVAQHDAPCWGMGPTERRVQFASAFGSRSIVSRQHVKWGKA